MKEPELRQVATIEKKMKKDIIVKIKDTPKNVARALFGLKAKRRYYEHSYQRGSNRNTSREKRSNQNNP